MVAETPKAGHRLNLVSTCRGSTVYGPSLLSFVSYHLHIGCHKVFLFLEHVAIEVYSSILEKFGNRVEVLVLNTLEERNAFYRKWCRIRSPYQSRKLETWLGSVEDINARQVLNAWAASEMILGGPLSECGSDWIVHLDSDELLYWERQKGTVQDTRNRLKVHLEELERKGIDQIIYVNHEAVPSTSSSQASADFFSPPPGLPLPLFKKHHSTLPLSEDSQHGMQFFKRRTTHAQYFLFYDNGKSIVRVVPGILPSSQHKWALPASHADGTRPGRTVWSFADHRSLDVHCLYEGEEEPPCVLHCPVVGEKWLLEKYRGQRNEKEFFWFNLRIPPCFHRDCLEAGTKGRTRELDLRDLFKQIGVSEEEKGELKKRGVAFEVDLRALVEEARKEFGLDTPGMLAEENESTLASEKTLKEVGPRPSSSLREGVDNLDKSWIIASSVMRFIQGSK